MSTGIKTCKVTIHETGEEIQHNFTFGIMPPPYNYDSALFGYLSAQAKVNAEHIIALDEDVTNLKARVTALENRQVDNNVR